MEDQRPSVFKYGNYRTFLQDMVRFLRTAKKYSNRALAKHIGIKGHTYLNMVIAGKRNLHLKTARRFAQVADLNAKETKFFFLLIQFNEAIDLEDKNELFLRLSKIARSELIQPKLLNTFEIYRDWRNIAIFQALDVDFRAYPAASVAEQLGMTSKQVLDVLEQLKAIGLAGQTGSKWKRTVQDIETPPEVESLFVANFHLEMTKLAVEKIKSLSKDQRELGAVTLSLSSQEFERLRIRVREFTEEVLRDYSSMQPVSDIYHLQLQLFPVLKI